jgi:hypothetical protein
MSSIGDLQSLHTVPHDVGRGSRRWQRRPVGPCDEDGQLNYNYPLAKERTQATDVVSNDVVALAMRYWPVTTVATA